MIFDGEQLGDLMAPLDLGWNACKVPLALWYANNVDDIPEFEKQMRRKVHYVNLQVQ
jgi:hypothetical protein